MRLTGRFFGREQYVAQESAGAEQIVDIDSRIRTLPSLSIVVCANVLETMHSKLRQSNQGFLIECGSLPDHFSPVWYISASNTNRREKGGTPTWILEN